MFLAQSAAAGPAGRARDGGARRTTAPTRTRSARRRSYTRAGCERRYRWVVLAAGTLAQTGFSAVVRRPARARTRAEVATTGSRSGRPASCSRRSGSGCSSRCCRGVSLADRVDERRVIATGLTGAAALLVVARPTHELRRASRRAACASGALGASVNAASGRAIMAWFPPTERGLALGIRQTAIPIGGAVGAVAPPRARVGRRHAAAVPLPRRRRAAIGAIVAAIVRPRRRRRRRAGARRRRRSRSATRACGCSAAAPALYPHRADRRSRASSSSSSTSTAACRRKPRRAVLAAIYVLGDRRAHRLGH